MPILVQIKKRGGLLIRVDRNTDTSSEHPSETALDNYKFDYVIDNNLHIGNLELQVQDILILEKLI